MKLKRELYSIQCHNGKRQGMKEATECLNHVMMFLCGFNFNLLLSLLIQNTCM